MASTQQEAVRSLARGGHSEVWGLGDTCAAEQYRKLVHLVLSAAATNMPADLRARASGDLRRYALWVRVSLESLTETGNSLDPGIPSWPDLTRMPTNDVPWQPSNPSQAWQLAILHEPGDPAYLPAHLRLVPTSRLDLALPGRSPILASCPAAAPVGTCAAVAGLPPGSFHGNDTATGGNAAMCADSRSAMLDGSGMSRSFPPLGGANTSRAPTMRTCRRTCTTRRRKSMSSTASPNTSPCMSQGCADLRISGDLMRRWLGRQRLRQADRSMQAARHAEPRLSLPNSLLTYVG